jgi:hypothetical protein
MLSDKKLVNDVEEKGMSGYDVKLSGQAPYLPWAKIKGTYYHWDTTAGLKALLAIAKLVNFCLLPSGSFTVSLP